MLLLLRSSEVSDEFDLSASDNLAAPSPILLSVLSEDEMKITSMLLSSSSLMRDVFDLRALNNLIPPSLPILLSVSMYSENVMKQLRYC
jgi:hypothetical protein